MNKKNTILFCLCFVSSLFGFGHQNDSLMLGERIDGLANVRNDVNGDKVLFVLYDNLHVECTKIEENWVRVGCYVMLNDFQSKAFKLQADDTLYDKKGNIIGIAKDEVYVCNRHAYNGNNYGFIVGYTPKKNIKHESIVENLVVQLLHEFQDIVKLDDLIPIIKSFEFVKTMDTVNEVWYSKWDDQISDPSPRDRITLIFKNDTLSGIKHSRIINFNNKKTYKLIRGHLFTPILKYSESEIKEFLDEQIDWYKLID
jgi:hypothetical protein